MLEAEHFEMDLVEVGVLGDFPERLAAVHQGLTVHDVGLEDHRVELLMAAAALNFSGLLKRILYSPKDLDTLLSGLQFLHQLFHLFKHLRRLGHAILLRRRLLLLLLLFQLLLYEIELLVESYELLLLLFDLPFKLLVVPLELLVFFLDFVEFFGTGAEVVGILL